MKNYYLTLSGTLKRNENTLLLKTEDEKISIPVNDIDAIFCFGELAVNSKLMSFLSQKNIALHYFNYYGYYTGSFYPREYLNSGHVVVKQVLFYNDNCKRLHIAKELLLGASHNILRNLRYYQNKRKRLNSYIKKIEKYKNNLNQAKSIEELMGIEGNIRQIYYSLFDIIIPDLKFDKRSKQPPENIINCMISFCNSLVYSEVLTQLYKTQLNPTVSFLHQPSSRRYSLSLDLSEVFKPVIADRLLFRVLNKKIVKEDDFDEDLNYCYLNKKGKKKVLSEFDNMLKRTVKHREINKHVSYKRLIRMEGYKLIKHLLGEQEYEAFRRWW